MLGNVTNRLERKELQECRYMYGVKGPELCLYNRLVICL